jgi:hypothetical protein
MCSSRCAFCVSMEDRSTVAVTLESSGSAPVTNSPSNEVKPPRTLLTIMWRTTKDTSEWTASMVQVPAT